VLDYKDFTGEWQRVNTLKIFWKKLKWSLFMPDIARLCCNFMLEWQWGEI